MTGKSRQGILPFRIEKSEEPLIARGGLVLAYEMAEALRLPQVIDRELPSPGSGRGYKPAQFVMPLVLMFHGGGKKLEDLSEIKGEMSLRELVEMDDLPASCTVGDWLRGMGKDGRGLQGLERVNRHQVAEVLRRDARTEYTLDVDASVIEADKEQAQCAGSPSVVNMTYSGVRPSLPSPGIVKTTTSPTRPLLSPPACNWPKFRLSCLFSRYTPHKIANPATKKMAPPMASQANLEIPRAIKSCASKAKALTNSTGPITRLAHLMIRRSASTPSLYHTLCEWYNPA